MEKFYQPIGDNSFEALADDGRQRDWPVGFGIHNLNGLGNHADNALLPPLRKVTDFEHVAEQVLENFRAGASTVQENI